MGISLPVAFLGAFIVSAILVALNRGGFGVVVSAGAVIVACLIVGLMQYLSPGTANGPRAVQLWFLLLCVPMVAVFAVSRFGVVENRPWLLLLLGPLSFVFTQALVVVGLNIFTTYSRH
jgi:hypothetical protein